MYPLVRMVWQLFRHRHSPPLGIFDEHQSRHICLPWDLDVWGELNNGRTLTLYDLGRVPMAKRTNLAKIMQQNKWGMVVAGASVRYRRRILMFDRINMRSRVVGWDDRFLYLEQSMWKRDGSCANHILMRGAFTSKEGMITPAEVLSKMGQEVEANHIPDWVRPWIDAANQRPWPPMQD